MKRIFRVNNKLCWTMFLPGTLAIGAQSQLPARIQGLLTGNPRFAMLALVAAVGLMSACAQTHPKLMRAPAPLGSGEPSVPTEPVSAGPVGWQLLDDASMRPRGLTVCITWPILSCSPVSTRPPSPSTRLSCSILTKSFNRLAQI
jgi:hypothetical protein